MTGAVFAVVLSTAGQVLKEYPTPVLPVLISKVDSTTPQYLDTGKLKLFNSMEVLFPEYFQSIFKISPYHEKHFHTMELDKTKEIGSSNLLL